MTKRNLVSDELIIRVIQAICSKNLLPRGFLIIDYDHFNNLDNRTEQDFKKMLSKSMDDFGVNDQSDIKVILIPIIDRCHFSLIRLEVGSNALRWSNLNSLEDSFALIETARTRILRKLSHFAKILEKQLVRKEVKVATRQQAKGSNDCSLFACDYLLEFCRASPCFIGKNCINDDREGVIAHFFLALLYNRNILFERLQNDGNTDRQTNNYQGLIHEESFSLII